MNIDSHECATIPLHKILDGALLEVLQNIFLHIYSLGAFEGNTLRKQETTQVNLTLKVPITFLLCFKRTVETTVFPLFVLCSSISYSTIMLGFLHRNSIGHLTQERYSINNSSFISHFHSLFFPISIKWNKEHTYVLKIF